MEPAIPTAAQPPASNARAFEPRAARDPAHQERNACSALMSDDAVITTTRDNLVLSWNGGAERLTGYAAREAIGKNLCFLFPEKHREIDALNVRDVLAGVAVRNSMVKARSKAGVVSSFLYSLLPMKDPTGRVVGILRVCKDLSAFRDARLALERVLSELRGMDQLHDSVHRAVSGDRSIGGAAGLDMAPWEEPRSRAEFLQILRDETATLSELLLRIRVEIQEPDAGAPAP